MLWNKRGQIHQRIPPVSSHGGFTISAYSKRYRDTNTISDIPFPPESGLRISPKNSEDIRNRFPPSRFTHLLGKRAKYEVGSIFDSGKARIMRIPQLDSRNDRPDPKFCPNGRDLQRVCTASITLCSRDLTWQERKISFDVVDLSRIGKMFSEDDGVWWNSISQCLHTPSRKTCLGHFRCYSAVWAEAKDSHRERNRQGLFLLGLCYTSPALL